MLTKRAFGRIFVSFVALLTLSQVLFLHHMNRLFYVQEKRTQAEIEQLLNPSLILSAKAKQILAQLQHEYAGVTVSPNGQYATYLEEGATDAVHVESLATGKPVSVATDLYPVQYIGWLDDEEVFVGEQITPGELELNTFYVSTGQQADVTAGSVPVFSELSSDAQIVKVTYSSQTNDIFVLINSSESSALYHIGTMEDVQSVPYGGGYVKNIALTQDGTTLYIEENIDGSWDVVRLRQESTTSSYSPEFDMSQQVVQSNAALLGTVNNTLYYGTVNQNGLVVAIYKEDANGKTALVEHLNSPTMASDILIDEGGHIFVHPVASTSTTVS
ncbi:hypothetical protein [Alicyclobacillus acidiphilus]|uniref:hypothetical protein n=1 Tax=Alicyclobacillus acidiphilus TaxID=182455 RepID=UPI000A567885|nr:hypothetical protein [Alicyclobacillus acidiphilus]